MRKLVLYGALLAFTTMNLHAQQDSGNQAQADQLFRGLLAAQASKDYEAFVANGTLELKAALTKTQFDASSDILNKRMNGGYALDSLGELNQRGFQVYLYRLRFKDGGDDILATLSLKSGQVAGIYFK